MLLSGALFALFMMGFWLYCLTDAILTPAPECRGLSKPAWIAVIALTFIGGAIAWLIVREPPRNPSAETPSGLRPSGDRSWAYRGRPEILSGRSSRGTLVPTTRYAEAALGG